MLALLIEKSKVVQLWSPVLWSLYDFMRLSNHMRIFPSFVVLFGCKYLKSRSKFSSWSFVTMLFPVVLSVQEMTRTAGPKVTRLSCLQDLSSFSLQFCPIAMVGHLFNWLHLLTRLAIVNEKSVTFNGMEYFRSEFGGNICDGNVIY